MTVRRYGVTVQAHIEQLLVENAGTLLRLLARVRAPAPMTAAEREVLWRSMSGVQADAEMVRLWLVKGALRDDPQGEDMPPRSKIVRVDCVSADEAANVQRALENREVRFFLNLVGALLPLQGANRTQVLEFVGDTANAAAGRLRIETQPDGAGDAAHQVDATLPLKE